MADKQPEVEEAPENVRHLDRDPNDPRNVPPADKLPSLNDEDQN